jgi:protein-tyrosine phosphatase
MKTVLFICTGNYYRSRFAEAVFNFHAKKEGLDWRADSAGLKVVETRHQNPGPISTYTLRAFEEYQIHPTGHERDPQPVTEELLNQADLIIATSALEHTSMVQEKIPEHATRVQFWEVEDVEFLDPQTALKSLYHLTLVLLSDLKEK